MNDAIGNARQDLFATLSTMTYADNVDTAALRSTLETADTEIAVLDAVRLWLIRFEQTLQVAKTTTASMARELSELRDQRSAIRAFLGTNQVGER